MRSGLNRGVLRRGADMIFVSLQVWEKAGCNLAVVNGYMPVEALYAANDLLRTNGKLKKQYKPGEHTVDSVRIYYGPESGGVKSHHEPTCYLEMTFSPFVQMTRYPSSPAA